MITNDEIKKLAHLARIEVSDEEVAGYAKDLESILSYVDQIAQVDMSDLSPRHLQGNVAREDTNASPSGQNNEAMLADAPASQDGFYKVPKIL